MPSLLNTTESTSVKMMLIGDAGTGKTGALASLAEAGYDLHILDFDNGTEILGEIFKAKLDKKEINQEQFEKILGRIYVEGFFDKTKLVGKKLVSEGMPSAFTRSLACLNDWPEHGNVGDWDDSKILVIDSTTQMSEAAFRLAVAMNPSCKYPLQWYGTAQEMVQKVLEMLYSSEIKCHVIWLTHINYIEVAEGLNKGYPMTVGKALSLKISRYFNVILGAGILGAGPAARRVINTKPTGTVDLKCPVLSGLGNQLPQTTGLAEYFKAKVGARS